MADALNLHQILSLVRETNKEFTSELYIPSTPLPVPVLAMNATHLKDIIKTAMNGVFAANGFNRTMYGIITSIVDPSISPRDINTFDKVAILLQLRMKNVTKPLEVDVKHGEDTMKVTVNLNDHIQRCRETILPGTIFVTDGSCEIQLQYPSIQEEYAFDEYFHTTRISKVDETDRKAIRELFGPLFIQELTVYIKNLTIGETVIDLTLLSPKDRIAVVEGLPGNLITSVIAQIDAAFGAPLQQITAVQVEIDGKEYTGSIPLSPALFA